MPPPPAALLAQCTLLVNMYSLARVSLFARLVQRLHVACWGIGPRFETEIRFHQRALRRLADLALRRLADLALRRLADLALRRLADLALRFNAVKSGEAEESL